MPPLQKAAVSKGKKRNYNSTFIYINQHIKNEKTIYNSPFFNCYSHN